MKPHHLSTEYLRRRLNYDPLTGLFLWLYCDYPQVAARTVGKQAGSVDCTNGYVKIHVGGARRYAHHLAWKLSYDKNPDEEIDHINGIRTDNRLCNLREATRKQNASNLPVNPTNSSGVTGVSWDKRRGLWIARICTNTVLGRYSDFNEAVSVRRAAEIEHFGEFIRKG